ncbi:MAG: hypothetical protein Q9227_007721 [Pyrenula ochraceoflavens]
MSRPRTYHGAEPSNYEDDSGAEDLDLQELDPITSVADARGSSWGRRHSPGDRNGFASRIALKNLKGTRRGRRWRNTNFSEATDHDDLEGLLQDEDDAGDGRSNGKSHKDRGEAMHELSTRHESMQPEDNSLARLGSRLRLPLFQSKVQLPNDSQEEDQNDVKASGYKASRDVLVRQVQKKRYPANVVSNAKYSAWSFLPRTLYNEFSFFLNIYFLLVALSQIIPYLRIGYMSTYIAPLAMVLTITIGKEALDDIARRRRDSEANSEPYHALPGEGEEQSKKLKKIHRETSAASNEYLDATITKQSRSLKVGDVLVMKKNERFPADCIILQSVPNDTSVIEVSGEENRANENAINEAISADDMAQKNPPSQNSGETFIRTDQLDGETDWKLRLPSPLTQSMGTADFSRLRISAGAPSRNVNDFAGTIELAPAEPSAYDPHIPKPANEPSQAATSENTKSAPLTIDNTAWANTVLASNTTTYAVVIYTGSQTRSAMSTAPSRSKTGLLEREINNLTKILCLLTLTLSIVLVALEGFEPTNKKKWYVAILIYLILFSTIIPISLRVNLDMGKTVYARFIEKDKGIPDTVVRTSTIPEDLGRIEYLLSDKTGTLTQNEMELRKIHVGTVSYANDAMDEVTSYVRQGFASAPGNDALQPSMLVTPSSTLTTQVPTGTATRTRREIGSRVRDLLLALALCHNVTPTTDEQDGEKVVSYQASSPDEIAIVQYTENVGLRLVHRDRKSITLQSVATGRVVVRVHILNIFPFTSDSKRMGIIVRFSTGDASVGNPSSEEDDVWFFQKGADTVMTSIVAANDWLDEETANMAREGLRTLVVGRKRLVPQNYDAFSTEYRAASLALQDRDAGMAAVVKKYLEHDLELLGVTGVEDKLQADVKPSLELLRNAGIKIWMLTGDKVETARCVAISAKLVSRGQYIHTVAKLRQKSAAQDALDFLRNKTDSCLLIDGESLALMLTHFRGPFISLAVLLPAVVACRCSPTQKAEVANLIRQHTRKRICCIGDGGNDVSMIQAADVGIGIVGKEGRQASLAADFSITQFCYLTKLLVWHGRNSYKRSAKLAQFIIHRGLIISVCQTMYSIAGHFDPKGLFVDWLLVGYATVYTMAPVFSLVLDRDVDEKLANLYPELYKELKTGQSLSYSTFFTWVLVSIYQGTVIQGLSQLLVGAVTGPRLISVSFTVLVLNELIMVAVSVTTWHPIMIFCIVGTGAIYAGSVPFLGRYFDLEYVITWGWVWRVAAVAAISLVPVWGGKLIRRTLKPPSYRKVRGI